MTLFLIILAIFIVTCILSNSQKKKKMHDYISATTSNCRLEYQIGCDAFNDFVTIYAKYASIDRLRHPQQGYTLIEATCGLFGKDEPVIKEYLENNDVYSALLDVRDDGFDKWILSPFYRDGEIFAQICKNRNKKFNIPLGSDIYVESTVGISYYQMLKRTFCKYYTSALIELEHLKPKATELRSKYAIDKVAEHYGLPLKNEIIETTYSANRESLASLIFEYAEREIKKQGFAGAQKGFYHFTPNPSENDYKKAEECDTFTVRSKRTEEANKRVKEKYPWM